MEWDIETQVGYIFRFWISNELNLLINLFQKTTSEYIKEITTK